MVTHLEKSPQSKASIDFQHLIKERGEVRAVAMKMMEMPPRVNPPILGSRTRIWKQDPSVKELNLPRSVYIHGHVSDGPKDSQIAIAGLPIVSPDFNRDFLIDPISDVAAFDAVHTYTVVRQVLTMYQRVLGRKLQWQWNRNSHVENAIAVYPHAGRAANAYYSRNERVLKFFFFTPFSQPPGAPDVYTCRSLDIVAHEAGHAILDSLKPNWILSNASPQTGGLHEAFGDLTSIFLILSQLDLVEYIIAETKADLHRPGMMGALAEEFGNALGLPEGLRNADNNLKLSEVSNEVHEISQVFTGAVFDILADIFTASRNPRIQDDAEVLYNVGKYMASLVIRAIENSPNENASFADVAEAMLEIVRSDGQESYASSIAKNFEVREVLGSDPSNRSALDWSGLGIYADRSGCCGTMQRFEYQP